MQVRGAPLIGATAAFGIALALRHDGSDAALRPPTPACGQPARPRSTSTGPSTACRPPCAPARH
jgi:methylthioribose-1-phosphate isomerase